ncbi:hypothetical protein CARUB_v10008987mg [Capsella rubella]|uniref:EF-hand domain-containing protein n=1 Tax=Capsella rubella TaxID=81985 RepID=R0GWD6_9BRAS|nr:uncharacterized calcium-binding protein At1g02270 [Capsella rubella]EOA40262.1 hypothetical protein CARUB_v10008987mg [Capsella rubella]
MQSHQNRRSSYTSTRLSFILRSRFIPSPLSFFFVFAAVPLPIYFSGLLARINKPASLMRFNSNLASSMVDSNISCTTFNILAPIYKRVDQKNQSIRESDFRALWLARNQRILDLLLHKRSSVICLQEVWVGNEELVKMYHEQLGTSGYTIFQLARTNGRGDGLLTAIHKDHFKVLNYRELLFNDFGDRVAQLLHVKSVVPFPLNGKQDIQQEVIIVNTHLLFPHESKLSFVRLHQVYKILEYLEAYQKENKLNHMPIILCGDWNGSKRGHVYKFLRSQGFISSYDDAHQYTDSDAHRWVSHRNHRGNICGVDFIWLCNPSDSRKPLRTSWVEAVFSIGKQLHKASIAKGDAFAFLGENNRSDSLTYSDFCQLLQKVNLTGTADGLSVEETKELWVRADLDGNGVFDYEELKKIWNTTMVNKPGNCKESMMESKKEEGEEEAIGLRVKKAVLFPQEAEKGLWPENYNISDHACLTVQFSPVKMVCS